MRGSIVCLTSKREGQRRCEHLGPAVHVHASLKGLGLISKRGEREGELALRLKTTRKRREKKNKRRRKKDKKRDSIREKKLGYHEFK